jgi:hypothetical protein
MEFCAAASSSSSSHGEYNRVAIKNDYSGNHENKKKKNKKQNKNKLLPIGLLLHQYVNLTPLFSQNMTMMTTIMLNMMKHHGKLLALTLKVNI